MMGGIVGRLFREFALTLSAAVAISLVLSLSTTTMMCAHPLKAHPRSERRRFRREMLRRHRTDVRGHAARL
jgi:multidrug efflux pump